MARLSFPGLADYERRLSRLMEGVPQIAGKAIYAGADLVADAAVFEGVLPAEGVAAAAVNFGFRVQFCVDFQAHDNFIILIHVFSPLCKRAAQVEAPADFFPTGSAAEQSPFAEFRPD